MENTESVKRVARGVIQISPDDYYETLYLMGQRRFNSNREMRGFWECFGGSVNSKDESEFCNESQLPLILQNTVKRELSEELPGITNIEVGELLHTHRRRFMFLPQEARIGELNYDFYESAHFLVRAVLPTKISVDVEEHCGYGLFTLKQVCNLAPNVRPCSLDAIIKAHKLCGVAPVRP